MTNKSWDYTIDEDSDSEDMLDTILYEDGLDGGLFDSDDPLFKDFNDDPLEDNIEDYLESIGGYEVGGG